MIPKKKTISGGIMLSKFSYLFLSLFPFLMVSRLCWKQIDVENATCNIFFEIKEPSRGVRSSINDGLSWCNNINKNIF